ncbi:hypothetical protein OHA40_13595 [Nocardia sp. NBC_00508]|uniref:hypothetical protein n=1 Tax=Nocardia sp. NBC_00508 TaxID=2975992 RepID=UPI002E8035F1|nr:hypothetical protein [Nocardia sp. NBC_00508]WUD69062.1 hypothetical protein OHA40_13595 [Nocardia sp. NBC_00508]
MPDWHEFNAPIGVAAAVVALIVGAFFPASRWWRRPLQGPSIHYIAERVSHEELCLLGWPPLGWPAVEPQDRPEFRPGDANVLMRVHRECDAGECSWKTAAVETLRVTGRMKPSTYRDGQIISDLLSGQHVRELG